MSSINNSKYLSWGDLLEHISTLNVDQLQEQAELYNLDYSETYKVHEFGRIDKKLDRSNILDRSKHYITAVINQ